MVWSTMAPFGLDGVPRGEDRRGLVVSVKSGIDHESDES